MHNAPSVSYPVGRSRFEGALLLMAWSSGALACAAWWVQVRPDTTRLAASAVALAGLGALALGTWLRRPAGTLAWDGQGWSWTSLGEVHACLPDVALDAQRWLLLRLSADLGLGLAGASVSTRRSTWLWLARSASPSRWDDLRRAVYSRAKPAPLSGAQPPGQATP